MFICQHSTQLYTLSAIYGYCGLPIFSYRFPVWLCLWLDNSEISTITNCWSSISYFGKVYFYDYLLLLHFQLRKMCFLDKTWKWCTIYVRSWMWDWNVIMMFILAISMNIRLEVVARAVAQQGLQLLLIEHLGVRTVGISNEVLSQLMLQDAGWPLV